MEERLRALVAPFDDGDDGEVKWQKHVRISEGVSDPEKLMLLGKLMKGVQNVGKRSRLVRQTTLRVLHNTGQHVEQRQERDGFGKLNPTMASVPGVAPHDLFGEAEAVQKWVQGARYTFDPASVECFFSPRRALVDIAKGEEGLDCDDLSVLCTAMLGSIGFETALLVTNPKGPGTPYSHAMGAFKFPKPVDGFYGDKKFKWPADRWIAMELTIPEKLGWVPPKANQFLYFKMDE